MTTFVMSGNREEFNEYCEENGLDPNQYKDVVYISPIARIVSYEWGENDTLVRVGTWRLLGRDRIVQILDMLHECGMEKQEPEQ